MLGGLFLRGLENRAGDWVESAGAELRKRIPVNDLVRLVLSYTHWATLLPLPRPAPAPIYMDLLWSKAVKGATTIFLKCRVHRMAIHHEDHCWNVVKCNRREYIGTCDFYLLASLGGRVTSVSELDARQIMTVKFSGDLFVD